MITSECTTLVIFLPPNDSFFTSLYTENYIFRVGSEHGFSRKSMRRKIESLVMPVTENKFSNKRTGQVFGLDINDNLRMYTNDCLTMYIFVTLLKTTLHACRGSMSSCWVIAHFTEVGDYIKSVHSYIIKNVHSYFDINRGWCRFILLSVPPFSIP